MTKENFRQEKILPVDYYKILGVTRNAALHEIKKAFRAKAMDFHPDKNKSSDARGVFVKINQAYEVLSDPIKRKKYDYIYYREEFNTQPKYSQEKEQRWEQTVKNAAETGKVKAEQYAHNYEYFSRRVLKTAGFEILIEIVLSLIVFDIANAGLLMGLVLFIAGIILSIIHFQSGIVFIGLMLTVIGFFIMRSRYREIVRGED